MRRNKLFEYENGIIRDESVLLETFIPTRLLHREGQLEALASCLRPVTKGRRPRNAFLYGPTGTGKTAMCLYVFEQLSSYTGMAKTIYINCWKNTTTHSILCELVANFGRFVHRREPVKELMLRFEGELRENRNRIVIIAFDEVDQLKDDRILYDLLRNGCGVICIANDEHALIDVDSRIKSSLQLERIEFPAYKEKEMYDILSDRAKLAFMPDSIEKKQIELAAKYSNGDARVGLEILRRAALLAEDECKKKIEDEHIERAWEQARFLRKDRMLEKLNDHEKILYRLVEDYKQISSGDLYQAYCSRVSLPVTERAYRKYMERLVHFGLVKARGEGRWREYIC
jgi:orc1/cdc6 family replication initiation protein